MPQPDESSSGMEEWKTRKSSRLAGRAKPRAGHLDDDARVGGAREMRSRYPCFRQRGRNRYTLMRSKDPRDNPKALVHFLDTGHSRSKRTSTESTISTTRVEDEGSDLPSRCMSIL